MLVGGGGCRNQYLMSRLQSRLPESSVLSDGALQIDADYKEAIAFAILAYWRSRNVPGNLPSVTGAHLDPAYWVRSGHLNYKAQCLGASSVCQPVF